MNQLECDRGIDRVDNFLITTAARPVDQQDQQRPKPLAAAIDQVVTDFRR